MTKAFVERLSAHGQTSRPWSLILNARLKGTVAILAAKLYSVGYIGISLSLDKVKVDAFNDDNGNLIRKKN